MRRDSTLFLLAASLLVAGCATDPSTLPVDQAAEEATSAGGHGVSRISVMSRNMYIGADVDRVIGALASPDPADDLPALLGALAVVQATDFPKRARAMALEIAITRPHVVGLQEVSKLDVDLTPLGVPAPVIHQDFLATLQASLNRLGLHYAVAASVQNTTASPLPGVSLVDMDVLLYDRSRVSLIEVLAAKNFQFNIGVVAPGVNILRGYVAARFKVGGVSHTVLNTHLESGNAAGLDQLRAAQATEIATVLGGTSPAVLLGDFNGNPDSPMHQVLDGAGFLDVWGTLRPRERGFTCCHAEDLSNPRADFDQRIDYVWSRGLSFGEDKLIGAIVRVGFLPIERIRGPLHPIWPSDHAGLVATLLTPPVRIAHAE